MTLLFDRKYNLTIGEPSRTVYVPKGESGTVTDGYSVLAQKSSNNSLPTPYRQQDFRTEIIESTAVLIKDLQITASITGNSISGSSNGGTTITISNLSEETRAIVERVNNYVILEAGYAEDETLPMIFSGQVRSAFTKRQGQNLVTTLQCEGGYTPNNAVRVSKSFTKDNTYGDILTYLAQAYADNGVPTGELVVSWVEGLNPQNSFIAEYYPQIPSIVARPSNTKLLTGYSIMGYLRQALDTVCTQLGYVNYIVNGKLFIHPKGYTKTVERYDFSTNQIKSIRNLSTKGSGTADTVGVEGIKIITFLDGRLDTDKRVRILDGKYKGDYKIAVKTHTLDYERGQWSTEVDCKKEDV